MPEYVFITEGRFLNINERLMGTPATPMSVEFPSDTFTLSDVLRLGEHLPALTVHEWPMVEDLSFACTKPPCSHVHKAADSVLLKSE